MDEEELRIVAKLLGRLSKAEMLGLGMKEREADKLQELYRRLKEKVDD